jgi:hypothetical protein
MTKAERTILLALLDTAITGLQNLRGAFLSVSKTEDDEWVKAPAVRKAQSEDEEFGRAFERMMETIKVSESIEEAPDAQ